MNHFDIPIGSWNLKYYMFHDASFVQFVTHPEVSAPFTSLWMNKMGAHCMYESISGKKQ